MWEEDWSTHVQCRLEIYTESPGPEADRCIWSCPKHEASFITAAALKIHARRTHGITEEHPVVFNKAIHSLNGLPTCSAFNKSFSKWQTLAQHMNQNSCPGKVKQPIPIDTVERYQNMPAPRAQEQDGGLICQREVVVEASKRSINAFIRHKQITRRTCELCGQWCTSYRTVKRHYQYSHPDLLASQRARISQLINVPRSIQGTMPQKETAGGGLQGCKIVSAQAPQQQKRRNW